MRHFANGLILCPLVLVLGCGSEGGELTPDNVLDSEACEAAGCRDDIADNALGLPPPYGTYEYGLSECRVTAASPVYANMIGNQCQSRFSVCPAGEGTVHYTAMGPSGETLNEQTLHYVMRSSVVGGASSADLTVFGTYEVALRGCPTTLDLVLQLQFAPADPLELKRSVGVSLSRSEQCGGQTSPGWTRSEATPRIVQRGCN